jgi:hypothetical protein
MKSLRIHFLQLLQNINPPKERRGLAKELVGDLRDWLAGHQFETVSPHTRLIGSYARSTAVLWIKDVDALVFVPESQLEPTPNAVLLELRKVLADYPDATVCAIGQQRSIRVAFEDHDFYLDIVPAVATDGLDEPLAVPDRPKEKWIQSDPLGYLRRLAALNKDHGEKVVPLVKLMKTWRDTQMTIRRPKSYMLEVMVVNAVESGDITLEGESWPSILAQLFSLWAETWDELMEQGTGVPRILDPQLGNVISAGWERSEFKAFMRRVREADSAAQRAISAETEEDSAAEWERLFGEHWPTDQEVKEAARSEATDRAPGRTPISSLGWVTGPASALDRPTRPTRFHGGGR